LRILGGASGGEPEARAYLQARLAVLWKVMFWAFVSVVALQAMLYELAYPAIRPQLQDWVYVVAACGLGGMAIVWRALLGRRPLALGTLYVVDLTFCAGAGLSLGAVAVLAYDFAPSHYTCMIYASFAVFTRTIVVPSSGRWTFVTSLVTFVPMVAAAIVLAGLGIEPPALAFVIGATLLCAVAVALATRGSVTIYGLRRQVSAAMQLGQYTLEKKLGEGGMGVVYRARHVMLRRPTAVKLLHPERVGAENLARFEREVQLMSTLTHPNTVAVFDYGRSPDGVFYYAMEDLGGGIDLENLVRRFGPQPAARVIQILEQVCGALEEAHGLQLIHRDIKPPNIILCVRGGMPDVVKVVDFGLVKVIGGEAGPILGTPAYVAPEVVTDPASIGPASDLYALGAVGYFLLTGRRVFEGKSALELCLAHVTVEVMAPSRFAPVPAELEAIVLRCLAKTPAARFASARELALALRAVPVEGGWSREDAARWWAEFERTQQAALVASVTPTMTITVSLGERSA
jgi:eukaryotic-like serine/threonine-protein kinase